MFSKHQLSKLPYLRAQFCHNSTSFLKLATQQDTSNPCFNNILINYRNFNLILRCAWYTLWSKLCVWYQNLPFFNLLYQHLLYIKICYAKIYCIKRTKVQFWTYVHIVGRYGISELYFFQKKKFGQKLLRKVGKVWMTILIIQKW